MGVFAYPRPEDISKNSTTTTKKGKMIEIRQPKNDSEKEMIHRLRYDVYCLEKKFIDPDKLSNKLEYDGLDEYSVAFFAIDSDYPDKIIGCFRLITENPVGFPIEKEFGVSLPVPSNAIVEISRLIVIPAFRGSGRTLLKAMFKEIYLYCHNNKIRHCYATVERPLLLILDRLGVTLRPLSDAKWYMNGLTLPTVLDLFEAEQKVQSQNPEFYRYATGSNND